MRCLASRFNHSWLFDYRFQNDVSSSEDGISPGSSGSSFASFFSSPSLQDMDHQQKNVNDQDVHQQKNVHDQDQKRHSSSMSDHDQVCNDSMSDQSMGSFLDFFSSSHSLNCGSRTFKTSAITYTIGIVL